MARGRLLCFFDDFHYSVPVTPLERASWKGGGWPRPFHNSLVWLLLFVPLLSRHPLCDKDTCDW